MRPTHAVALLAVCCIVAPALGRAEDQPAPGPQGELVLSFYGGKSWTMDSDVDLELPGGTDLTFHDVSWDDDSFKSPTYYGFRGIWWIHPAPNWGLSVDYTHAKAIIDASQRTRVTGSVDGVLVDAVLPIGDNLEAFEMSHGYNFLTFNALYRWFPRGHRDETLLGRLQLYVGAGAGIAIPHAEATVRGERTSETQLAGPAVQMQAGLNFDIWGPISGFTEYKVNWADTEIDLSGGGSIRTEAWTHQIAFGASLRFGDGGWTWLCRRSGEGR